MRGARYVLAVAFAVVVLPGLPLNMLAPKCEKGPGHAAATTTVAAVQHAAG